MKTIQYTFRKIGFIIALLGCVLSWGQQFTPIVPNTAPQIDSCGVTDGTFSINVPTEALSGANIPLNITLPGTLDAACNVGISIDFSQNLDFVSSGNVSFSQSGNTLTSTAALAGNDGQNFNVNFKFPSYVSCNNDLGTFTVTFTGCEGEVCTTTVDVKARAEDYWTVEKEFVTGNLVCGTSLWRHKVRLNNPNPFSQGTYSIQGTITDTSSLPIVSGATHTFSGTGGNNQFVLYGSTVLQNCEDQGTVITNTTNYSYTLGNGCEQKDDSTQADSDPLADPNGHISFTKSVHSNTGAVANGGTLEIAEGCEGRYVIGVSNTGNVPWTNLVITDDFNIPGLTITSILASSAIWSTSPAITPAQQAQYTFTSLPNVVLNPGEYLYIAVNFTIDSPNTIGNIIPNTANLSYQAFSASGNTNSGNTPVICQAITCPTIDTTIQNTSATVNVEVGLPTSIPNITKCIDNAPAGGIYQLGDTISFRILVGNKGSASLTTTVSDNLQLPGQNLQVVPGSVSYAYYVDNTAYANCNWTLYNQQAISFGTSDNMGSTQNPTNLQNPEFQITNMPGICDYGRANYTVITFDAIVLPQLYGNKTNTAVLTSGQNSSAAYAIDQLGVLEIDKIADVQIVENGQAFNYILTVTNSGTVPLDSIVITDDLPGCVSLSGPVLITDALGASISNTTAGALTITVNPTAQILPGDDMIITIPVTKSGSGSCCNITASVEATMTTSGVELNAIDDGTVAAPAACVIGTECCDIADFDASISSNNGQYSVQIQGGSTPIQEIEIAMVDYHVTYSDLACTPSDLGNFGTLSTQNLEVNNLLLNPTDNGTSSLTWLAGSPNLIDYASVILDIIDPEVLNLDCCESTFYFCLKVRVKDVNCNVCEITVCYSSDENDDDGNSDDGNQNGDNGDDSGGNGDDGNNDNNNDGNDNGGGDNQGDDTNDDNTNDDGKDCRITLQSGLNDSYCIGDTITLNWLSNDTSGDIDIILTNGAGGTTTLIASSIADTGSYNYTIPNLFDCDDSNLWSFVIRDSNNIGCSVSTIRVDIKCCTEDCSCGDWLSNTIEVTSAEKKFYDPDLPYSRGIKCGSQENSLSPEIPSYNFTAPGYQCNPETCDVSYEWKIMNTTNGQIYTHSGQSYDEFNFNPGDVVNYTVTPKCGGKRCEPCRFTVRYEK